ncbi:hypothetical protein GGI26_005537 [Coemansia sp. RSA 1358]|nr:hypothetical protein EDC05_005453 [Coemansia umbellata]KAJ2619775.1 hypothetical protein GGI26_005537 [Coemansia sp. RSA 1358]
MMLHSDEFANKTLRLLHGTAHLQAEGYSTILSLQGVYWSAYGSAALYGVRENNVQAAIDLVRAMPGKSAFEQAKSFYGKALEERLPTYKRFDEVAHSCEYQIYIQFSSIQHLLRNPFADISSNSIKSNSSAAGDAFRNTKLFEIATQSGLRAQAVMYAPNCSTAIATPHGHGFSGISIEYYRRKTIHYALTTLAVILAQAALLICQMRHTPTPAALSKISYQMLSMNVVLDSFIFVLHIIGCLAFGDIYIVFAIIAFLAFMVLMMFDMRYLTVVWRLQRPDVSDATTGEGRRELWLIYLRYYLILVPGIYIFYAYLDNGSWLVERLLGAMIFATYSYWIPQIWRNAKRGTSRGLRKDYIVGTTLLRLFFPVYLFGCPGNIAFISPTTFVWVVSVYNIAQAAVLILQDVLGPRFFIPKEMRPEVYDYHHPLPLSASSTDESTTINIDSESSAVVSTESEPSPLPVLTPSTTTAAGVAAETADDSHHNCAICMQPVDSAVPSANQQDRTTYMATPCQHVYHTECLTQWMDIKLECPVCRTSLPPL